MGYGPAYRNKKSKPLALPMEVYCLECGEGLAGGEEIDQDLFTRILFYRKWYLKYRIYLSGEWPVLKEEQEKKGWLIKFLDLILFTFHV